ncbi:Kef-type potassium/proton antiporter, CPA2 family [Faunimonas pinastri]|uniref:Kef-type potassium/proton antiporter, CPA2 family n=1 Tax=Faunimonas pinastri TaxID=1855383 RepID=A0A1H9C1V5_9HYPH|nr:cation:proton antiporter [Faunimonas pinastri]SEP95169.1 Kef-type potassium/proton antiporter, CPA2 family [Faunimonas pinastri]
MPHGTPLISTIVAGLVLAFILGAIANRFRLPPLVGYLIAGVLVGPHTPGFVADQTLAPELAEIGVILLMFGVGLHFSLRDLLAVRGISVPGAVVQIGCATLLGWGFGWLMGWPTGGSLVFGLALSVASTVVLLKALQERRLLESERGKIAIGWLIVEDLFMVVALVLIPALASIGSSEHATGDSLSLILSHVAGRDLGVPGLVGATLLEIVAFVLVMLLLGRRAIPWILHRIAHTGSRELFRLGVLAIALGVAFGSSQLFGVSLALGAFFAGMILSESELSHRAAQESLPLRDAFAVLFFVSVGMLFDPGILIREPLPVLATLFIIVVGKSIASFLIVLLFRRPVGTALTISASLAQIGEFSFILAELGVGLKLLPAEARDLILAGAILSIILNPLVFFAAGRLRLAWERRLAARVAEPAPGPIAPEAASPNEPGTAETVAVTAAPSENPDALAVPTALADHTILVGFGRVGSIVAEELADRAEPFLLIEDAEDRILRATGDGIEVISGNAASRHVLVLANLLGARNIVIAIPNAFEAAHIAEQARAANPLILIIARAHSDAEVEHLKRHDADVIIMGEREIARGMLHQITRHREAAPPEASGERNAFTPDEPPPPSDTQQGEPPYARAS